jgi:enoyl-CoA hydratase
MIEVETVEGIAVLRMQHGKANALDIEFCEALAARFNALRMNDEVEAIVLTGAGTMFSAGVDLKRLSAGGADYVRAFLPALHKLYEEVFFHPKPVVAAINGHAVAGGAILACCADRRIMAHEAGRIGVTEMLVGVPFPALAFEVLRAAVPAEYLAEFAYSGATYMTDDALECGWIDEIAEPEELLEDALAVAEELAALPGRPSRSPRRRSADPSPNVSPLAVRRSTARSRRCGAPTTRSRACAITWRGC